MNRHLILIITMPIFVILTGLYSNYQKSASGTESTIHGIPFIQAKQLLFDTADACMTCHNDLVAPSGENVSIGSDWRASMMANSARDPYWHAAVRREVMEHPESQQFIENECSTCHMPMAHYQQKTNGVMTGVFAHLAAKQAPAQIDKLALDGVSCTTCHQIKDVNFGARESFVGGFVIDTQLPAGQREVYGPYTVDAGRSTIMHSSSGFQQVESKHIQQSELCATCHTLYTHSLGPDGEVIGELPEQVPYLEWKHSSFVDNKSCQTCHMPTVKNDMPISSVWGQPRPGFSRHSFRGGNFFMMSMLNRYRDELGVKALPQEMDAAINRTIKHLQTKSALISIVNTQIDSTHILVDVSVDNLAGHKLPTAYPSRRTWIHFVVRDKQGDTLFESGAIQPDGSISGNDNDRDAERYEPHYSEINREDQVQIYEAIMAGPGDKVTTGLLTAIRFIKDNRILPKGFDKFTAGEDIAVHGNAEKDDDFIGGQDQVRYRIDLNEANLSTLEVSAALLFQPIAYRWAQNLDSYDAAETNRFTSFYNSLAENSSVALATTTASLKHDPDE